MSLIPEIILQHVIAGGINDMRRDPDRISQLFRNLPASQTEGIREFIRNNSIDIAIGYPRQDLKLPAIIIILKSENEQFAVLNDLLGGGSSIYEPPEEMVWDDENPPILGTGSVSSSNGVRRPTYKNVSVVSAARTEIIVSPKTFVPGDLVNSEIRITSGAGKGQFRIISDNMDFSVAVSEPFNVIPDSTSKFDIRPQPYEVIGDPPRIFKQSDRTMARYGSGYRCLFQINIVTDHQELTVFLYTIIKAILTINRVRLEGLGLVTMKMSGSDLNFESEFLPTFSYSRYLTLDFVYFFEVFMNIGDIATKFETSFSLRDPVTDPDGGIIYL